MTVTGPDLWQKSRLRGPEREELLNPCYLSNGYSLSSGFALVISFFMEKKCHMLPHKSRSSCGRSGAAAVPRAGLCSPAARPALAGAAAEHGLAIALFAPINRAFAQKLSPATLGQAGQRLLAEAKSNKQVNLEDTIGNTKRDVDALGYSAAKDHQEPPASLAMRDLRSAEL
ncbi:hypothetical protein EK904_009868 [Melospiza melodia maxima]|nr:hypothetical protein EK904_009868 [Melospiza melodia maxima]